MKPFHTSIIVVAIMGFIGCGTSNEWVLTTGQQPVRYEGTLVTTVSYDMLVHLPESAPGPNGTYPLIVFLHGSGERGSDPAKLKVHSLPKIIDRTKDFPFIVISPQCPEGKRWNADALNAMLEEALRRLPVDTNRIYLTGLSMGGFGVWKFAIAHPEHFAAIAPVCGWGHLEDVEKLKNMPVWVFHGAKDDVVPPSESEKMVEFLTKKGNTAVTFTLYPDANHNAWDRTYDNPELYSWFLRHTKPAMP